MAESVLESEQENQADLAKPAGRGLFRLVKVVAFVSVIVIVEIVVAAMMTPTAQDIEKLAQELAAASAGKTAGHDEHTQGDDHGESHNLREVELGTYNVTRFNPATNTTLVVVGTNADLPRSALAEVARMAADALGRRITPVGTQFDGDIIFAVSTSEVPVPWSMGVEVLAQDATAMAIERAVLTALGTKDVPGLGG